MTARRPRWEVVQVNAGWFARFVAANGRKMWQTEVYVKRDAAWNAVRVVEAEVLRARWSPEEVTELREVDERTPDGAQ